MTYRTMMYKAIIDTNIFTEIEPGVAGTHYEGVEYGPDGKFYVSDPGPGLGPGRGLFVIDPVTHSESLRMPSSMLTAGL